MKGNKGHIPSAVMRSGDEKYTWLKDILELSIGELIELYAYAEAIVETVREPLIILDKRLRVRSANKAFFDRFQTTKEETYGKLIYSLNGKEWNIPKLRKLLREILPHSTQFNDFEVSHDFKKIGQKTMLLNARRVILEESNTELILLAIEDITERKKLEQQKDEFINIASHELKTPITSIKVIAQIMQKRLKDIGNEKDQEIMYILNTQTHKLTDLVNRLLTIGRIDEGKKTMMRKKVDFDVFLKRIVKEFQHTVSENLLVLEGVSGVTINIDEANIEQVVINLLINATKYSSNGEKVIIKTAKQENEVIVSVKDNGVGIAKQEISKIFDRYYRTGEKNVRGFGLGLYISKKIVTQHGGRIWVESVKGQGSTFYFALPLK